MFFNSPISKKRAKFSDENSLEYEDNEYF